MAGIAVLGDHAVYQPDDVLSQPDESSRRLARLITPVTHAMETNLAANADTSAGKVAADTRAREIVRLRQMRRAANALGDYVYFEALKSYSGFDVIVSGWITQPRGSAVPRPKPSSVSIVEQRGGERGGPYELLGVVSLRDRTIWLGRAQGYESERFEIWDWKSYDAPGRIASISGGC